MIEAHCLICIICVFFIICVSVFTSGRRRQGLANIMASNADPFEVFFQRDLSGPLQTLVAKWFKAWCDYDPKKDRYYISEIWYRLSRFSDLDRYYRQRAEVVVRNNELLEVSSFVPKIFSKMSRLMKYYHNAVGLEHQHIKSQQQHDKTLIDLCQKVSLMCSCINLQGLGSIVTPYYHEMYVDQSPDNNAVVFRLTDLRRKQFVEKLKEFVQDENDPLFILWCFMWDLMCFNTSVSNLWVARAHDIMQESLNTIRENEHAIGNCLMAKIMSGMKANKYSLQAGVNLQLHLPSTRDNLEEFFQRDESLQPCDFLVRDEGDNGDNGDNKPEENDLAYLNEEVDLTYATWCVREYPTDSVRKKQKVGHA